MIHLHQLNHAYADGRLALDRINLTVAADERVAILGPNGAGKSTLFLRMCGVLVGRAQEVLIHGLDPANPDDRKRLPRQIGIVFQNPDDQLFCSTVLEDVAFGPLNLGASTAEARQLALEMMQRFGLAGLESRSPQRLSGGEKRRAALAGVLALKPSILLLDEPTMFLDPRGRREFIRELKGWSGTLLLATHDLELVIECCSRTVLLDAGRIIIDDETERVLRDGPRLLKHGLEVPHRWQT